MSALSTDDAMFHVEDIYTSSCAGSYIGWNQYNSLYSGHCSSIICAERSLRACAGDPGGIWSLLCVHTPKHNQVMPILSKFSHYLLGRGRLRRPIRQKKGSRKQLINWSIHRLLALSPAHLRSNEKKASNLSIDSSSDTWCDESKMLAEWEPNLIEEWIRSIHTNENRIRLTKGHTQSIDWTSKGEARSKPRRFWDRTQFIGSRRIDNPGRIRIVF